MTHPSSSLLPRISFQNTNQTKSLPWWGQLPTGYSPNIVWCHTKPSAVQPRPLASAYCMEPEQRQSLFPVIGYVTFPVLRLLSFIFISYSSLKAPFEHFLPGLHSTTSLQGKKKVAKTFTNTSLISPVPCSPYCRELLEKVASSLYFQHPVPTMLLKCKYVGERSTSSQ